MSSKSESTPDNEFAPWDDLTATKKRVAKTIAHVNGPTTFERPDFQDDVEASSTVEEVIDDKERVLTSLDYTRHLNDLTDAGYLVKESQGGKNPIILDLGYDEDRDDWEVAPYGNTSRLWGIVSQVLDREGLSDGALGDVDENDFNDVRDAVNVAVERTILVTVSEASEYRFRQEPYNLVRAKTEEAREDE